MSNDFFGLIGMYFISYYALRFLKRFLEKMGIQWNNPRRNILGLIILSAIAFLTGYCIGHTDVYTNLYTYSHLLARLEYLWVTSALLLLSVILSKEYYKEYFTNFSILFTSSLIFLFGFQGFYITI
ncbi:hypothetical protein [Photorhabdus khanii]|uniref:Uncharacterized protein n=1 Tax=Photorhabdus khanii subsp. guanajuatensis TaxID=2100166 RepID=A0A4V6P8J3_9GAMM|nr:hypothetical protein [Photorhabdus khanii]TDB61305.1 hypothetical protein C5467_05075 [Photorhabdus khanii subsp. guanajuatensis]